MLSIHLLGQPHFALNQTPFAFSAPPRTLPLWAYLLLHRDQPVERAQIAFTLWPDERESTARANLRRHLHYLQRALPPAAPGAPWLLSTADTLQWNPHASWQLDVANFERLAAGEETWAAAVPLYTGDLLENVYDDWLAAERERLRERYFAVLGQLLLRSRRQGDHAQAITCARLVLARDPFREDVVRQLLAVRYESGDRAGAMQEYERFARLLRDELGVEPMPETVTLYEAAARNARLPGAPGPSAAPAPAQPAPLVLPFSGRDAEMAQLSARWNRAVQGQGGLVLVSGEAGVGKTRLARELALVAETQGARVLFGRTDPAEPRPYQAVVEALHSALALLAAAPAAPARLAAAAALLPELKGRRALPVLGPLDPERERTRLFDALAVCIEHLAEPRPVLIVLEDLHWAAADTVALVEFLARRTSGRPALIVVTYREEETPHDHPLRALRRREHGDRPEHLPLDRLSAPAVTALLAQLFPAGAAELDVRLYAESEGNPLFLDTLLHYWLDVGALEAGAGGWRLTGAMPPAGPPDLHAAIDRRLARLSPRARTLAEVAAVCGAAFDAELVRAVGGWNDSQAADTLHELLAHQLVQEAAGHAAHDYSFAHHLIRSALYDCMPERRRIRRHRLAARAVAGLYPDSLDERAAEIARHYDLGVEPVPAAEFYLRAARQALAVYADQESSGAIARALELLEQSGAGRVEMRFELLALLESVHDRRGAREDQARDLDALSGLAERLDDDGRRLAVLLRRLSHAVVTWDNPRVRDTAAQALAVVSRLQAGGSAAAGGEEALAQVHLQLGRAAQQSGRYPDARAELAEAVRHARAAGLQRLEADCSITLGIVTLRQGEHAQARRHLEQALVHFRETGDQIAEGKALGNLAVVYRDTGDYAEALRCQAQALQLHRKTGDRRSEGHALNNLGTVFYDQGDYLQARQYFEQFLGICRELGELDAESLALNNLGMVASEQGDLDGARAYCEQALALARARGKLSDVALTVDNLGLLALQSGDAVTAEAFGRQALAVARDNGIRTRELQALPHLGRALMEQGRLVEAAAAHREALQMRLDLGNRSFAIESLADLAEVALRAGDLDEALAHTREVLAHQGQHGLEGADDPFQIQLTCYRVLRAAGDPAAGEILERAHRELQAKAAAIAGEPARRLYLENIPSHRALAAAWREANGV